MEKTSLHKMYLKHEETKPKEKRENMEMKFGFFPQNWKKGDVLFEILINYK